MWYRNLLTHIISLFKSDRIGLFYLAWRFLIEKLSAANQASNMVVRHHVEGYENFSKFVDGLKTADETYYFFFSGNKLPSGESWCPDCVEGGF